MVAEFRLMWAMSEPARRPGVEAVGAWPPTRVEAQSPGPGAREPLSSSRTQREGTNMWASVRPRFSLSAPGRAEPRPGGPRCLGRMGTHGACEGGPGGPAQTAEVVSRRGGKVCPPPSPLPGCT